MADPHLMRQYVQNSGTMDLRIQVLGNISQRSRKFGAGAVARLDYSEREERLRYTKERKHRARSKVRVLRCQCKVQLRQTLAAYIDLNVAMPTSPQRMLHKSPSRRKPVARILNGMVLIWYRGIRHRAAGQS